MLVLSQTPGEEVILTLPDGTEIRIAVLAIDRNRVRVGYAAPREIAIDREKIHKRKLAEKRGEEVNGNV